MERNGRFGLLSYSRKLSRDSISDLECLTMNIAIPSESAGLGPFPIMIWLHGGGFVYGGNEYPIYDGARLAAFAAKRGTPVLICAMNYRVNHGGFLASKDIQKDLEADGYSGVGNFGLTDQVVGLDWVQNHISYFNGDKTNVTVMGESAGSISVTSHMVSPLQPIFHRAICMSGQPTTVFQWTLAQHERRYQKLLKRLNIDNTQPGALSKLRAISERDLADAVNAFEDAGFPVGLPCIDGYYFTDPTPLDYTKKLPPTLRSMMVGHVRDEGSPFYKVGMKYNFDQFRKKLLARMSDAEVQKVLEIYNLSSDPTQ